MANSPEPDSTPPVEPPVSERPEEAGKPSPAAAPEGPASQRAGRPKSPREFIQERMRELDKKGS
jgi:hypothetical protein